MGTYVHPLCRRNTAADAPSTSEPFAVSSFRIVSCPFTCVSYWPRKGRNGQFHTRTHKLPRRRNRFLFSTHVNRRKHVRVQTRVGSAHEAFYDVLNVHKRSSRWDSRGFFLPEIQSLLTRFYCGAPVSFTKRSACVRPVSGDIAEDAFTAGGNVPAVYTFFFVSVVSPRTERFLKRDCLTFYILRAKR